MTSAPTPNPQSNLFRPLPLGRTTLSHRLVLAPLTRFRSSDAHIPLPEIMSTYYSQRGCVPGTLLVSEATFISPRASGMNNVPGIWSAEQIAAWRSVTDAVHAAGSSIFCQLWALGRAAQGRVMRAKGLEVVSSSAVRIDEMRPTPRALEEEEIWQFVQEYAQGARNAIEAGFDGVEIHGANGYLVDQFTQDTSNRRTDAWGGSIEKRARFAVEVVRAVCAAVGPDRTAIRLSPWSTYQAMRMADPIPQFTYLIRQLRQFPLAYLHLIEGRVQGPVDLKECEDKLDWAVEAWCGDDAPRRVVVLAGGYRPHTARETVDAKYPDKEVCVAFGRLWISNPDLVYRIKSGIPLDRYDRSTFYLPMSEKGYIDYLFSKEWEQEQDKGGEGRQSRL